MNEENQLTPEMAVLFENVTKIPAGFWIEKQAKYNEYFAGEKMEAHNFAVKHITYMHKISS